MFSPWRIATRPCASVIQRPAWPIGSCGAAEAAGPVVSARASAAARTLRVARTPTSCRVDLQRGPHRRVVAEAALAPVMDVVAREHPHLGGGDDVVQAPAGPASGLPGPVAAQVPVQGAEGVAPSRFWEARDERELGPVVAFAVLRADLAAAGARERLDLALPALVAGRVEVAGDHPGARARQQSLVQPLEGQHLREAGLLAQRRVEVVDLDAGGADGEVPFGPGEAGDVDELEGLSRGGEHGEAPRSARLDAPLAHRHAEALLLERRQPALARGGRDLLQAQHVRGSLSQHGQLLLVALAHPAGDVPREQLDRAHAATGTGSAAVSPVADASKAASSGNASTMSPTPAMHASPPEVIEKRGLVSDATVPDSMSPSRGPLVTTSENTD